MDQRDILVLQLLHIPHDVSLRLEPTTVCVGYRSLFRTYMYMLHCKSHCLCYDISYDGVTDFVFHYHTEVILLNRQWSFS